MYDSWTALEFPEVKQSILGKFSHDVSEPVANLLIRELVESVDRPGTASGIKLENEPELEWVMPVINYAFSLSFISPREYETIKAAIRIYLSWMTSITPEVQKSCPSSLIEHPDRYFRRMIEALRLIFLPRHIPYTVDADVIIDRQANEIRTVLSSIKLWTSKVHDDYRDEVWSRSLLFLIAVNEQLLTIPSTPDDIGPSVAPDLVQSLLDCWIHAALHELIPSPSYWKTLTLCSRRWVFHVPLIEIWSKKLLSLTILLVQKIHGNTENLKNISIDNIYLQEDIQNFDNLKETWLRLFHLLGNPAQFLLYSNRFIDNAQVDTNLLAYINGQISLSFFLAITAICKMIEIFYGNTQISTDFHEIDDLYHIWLDACKVVQDEWNRSYNRQRPSNMSSGSSGISGMNTLSTGIPAGDASTLTHQSLAASNSALAAGPSSTTISRKNTANFTHSLGSTKGQKITQSARTSQYTPQVPPEPVELPRLRPGQYVWYYLKNNKLTPLTKHENQPKVAHMMEIFLYWLYDPALSTLNPLYKKYSEDVISQRSMSSAEIDMQSVGMSGGVLGGLASPSDSGVTRHSFAQSTTSSSDISSPQNSHIPSNVFEYPSVDGVAAGRAAALGALCRIICAKSSREQLPDDQLAQFYTVMHEALIERDRLMLCSLLYYSVDLFKLGLRGIEILLPNYLMAIDVILTESMKLRLHPSIHEVEMRHACLRALASIIAWPTTFGPTSINDNNSRLSQGPGNVLEINPTYIEMRPRILRNLVYTLRHETDSTNLHLALSLCAIFCEECCRYDLSMAKSNVLQEKKVLQRQKASLDGDSPTDDDEEKYYAVSVLRGIVSAICDNLCKTQWNSETITSLAALDCLNVMATLPQSIVFSNREMSTGSLIVTSLCRFVDTQLQKPPPFHSRDLHSSVVAAYSSIQIWLCSAPMLTEIDACLTTVAQTIEFGLTGGKNMSPSEYKPASQRVYDAAELLLSTLFSVVGGNNPSTIIDERRLLYKYSPQNIDTTKFRHFLVRQHSLISIHEATHIDEISHGYPTLFMITRTPYHQAHTSIIQLRPKSFEAKDGDQENMQIFDVPSPGALAMTGVGEILNSISTAVQQKQSLRRASPPNESKSLDNLTSATGSMGTQKQFEFPPGFDKPQCKLDAAFPPLQPIPETDQIITQLSQIKNRLSQGGGSAIGQRDAHNVWIQSSLGSFLSQPPRPQSSVKKCNTGRIFLYDLGLINGNSFNKELIPLDSGQCDEFYRDLHQIVDRSATKILQTVGIFYVKDGQRTVGDILDNAMAIPTTRPEFCRFLAELGEGVDIATHPNWTGHWATAFSAERKPLEKPRKQDNYALDGINHCLWWSDSLHEIAYVMFSERSAKLSHLLAGGNGVDTQHLSSYTRGSSREMTLGEEDIARRGLSHWHNHLHQTASNLKAHHHLIHQRYSNNNKTVSIFNRPGSTPPPPPEVYACPQHLHYSLTIQTNNGGVNIPSSESEKSQMGSSLSTPSPHMILDSNSSGYRQENLQDLNFYTREETERKVKNSVNQKENLKIQINGQNFKNTVYRQESLNYPINSQNLKNTAYRQESLQHPYDQYRYGNLQNQSKKEQNLNHSGYRHENLHENSISNSNLKLTEVVYRHENLSRQSESTPKSARYSSLVQQNQFLNPYDYQNEDLPYEVELNPIDFPPAYQHENLRTDPLITRYSPSRNHHITRRVKRQSSVSPRFLSTSGQASPARSKSSSPTTEHDSRRLSEPKYEERGRRRNSRKDEEYGYNSANLARKFSESGIVFPQSVFVTDEPISPVGKEGVKIQDQPTKTPEKLAPTSSYSLSYIKSLFRKKSPEVKPKNAVNGIRMTENNEDDSFLKKNLAQGSPHIKLFSNKSSVVPQSVTNHDQNMPTSISSDLSQQNIPMTPAANAQNAKSRTKSTSTINSENSGPQRASSLSYHSHQDKPAKRNPDQRIFVVWLERIEDMYHFPYDQFFHVSEDGSRHTSQKPDFVIIFLHNFEPGLVRVHIEGIWTKYSQPGPLVDGMVISTTALSTMVRQTIISIARRRLIEVDQYQMVHLKRRNSIQDFAKKYTQTIQYRDFLDKFITL